MLGAGTGGAGGFEVVVGGGAGFCEFGRGKGCGVCANAAAATHKLSTEAKKHLSTESL